MASLLVALLVLVALSVALSVASLGHNKIVDTSGFLNIEKDFF
jgi:hypothetical protein